MDDERRLEPGTGPIADDGPEMAAREWTFMVYLAGDNNLEAYGRADLMEMKSVGSTSRVAIIAQFDGLAAGDTKRYHLQKGTSLEQDEVGESLGETNSGDPRELARFLSWAMTTYPANRYALVLWNHGTGWKEDDLYSVAVRSGLGKLKAPGILGPLIERIRCQGRPALFEPSVQSILARGIGYDDTSLDFLDNSEMRRALDAGLLLGGVEKLAVLGFDACMMNMVEVVYEIRNQVEYVVGSQETEPGAGWPYSAVLQQLVDQPSFDGAGLARSIVDSYIESYGDGENVTQSAISLAHVNELAVALSILAEYVLRHLEECALIVGRASRLSQAFADPDYHDIYDLCRQIVARSEQAPELARLAQNVMGLLVPAGDERLVIHEAHRGSRMREVYGLSIYVPTRAFSPFYGRLQFAAETLWDDMLQALISG